jgi:hypothetical protein
MEYAHVPKHKAVRSTHVTVKGFYHTPTGELLAMERQTAFQCKWYRVMESRYRVFVFLSCLALHT